MRLCVYVCEMYCLSLCVLFFGVRPVSSPVKDSKDAKERDAVVRLHPWQVRASQRDEHRRIRQQAAQRALNNDVKAVSRIFLT